MSRPRKLRLGGFEIDGYDWAYWGEQVGAYQFDAVFRTEINLGDSAARHKRFGKYAYLYPLVKDRDRYGALKELEQLPIYWEGLDNYPRSDTRYTRNNIRSYTIRFEAAWHIMDIFLNEERKKEKEAE